ncbi:M12 family metallo-peptidase [Neolewinella lacunae]|uniref:Proprotein convertase P-domain-containing protein n=1 Tax=Neolewinella lacunae TaxID=1517758 RepID=A0A923PFA2_9BACT|nr:zinc-dependent metalloprotease family protein [Neolewinella lacunae]MBC6993015.1 proprotein convertase P-domain-containing protein [Neolewinella lacunae]MDN3635837.1 M12 family metallo-peptidase [Neolewinella lacunae]
MRTLFLLTVSVFLCTSLDAQSWQPIEIDKTEGDRRIVVKNALGLSTDPAALQTLLRRAPHERDARAEESPVSLTLPDAAGQLTTFRIVAYDVMAPADQPRFPNIGTWYGINPARPGQTIFLDWTERGFHASVSGGGQAAFYVDPLYRGNDQLYQVYARSAATAPEHLPFSCQTKADALWEAPELPAGPKRLGDCVLRQYTLAVSATVAYTTYHGATTAAGAALVQSAVVTSVNRLNQVFTRDLSLRLQLVPNNDNVYFYAGGNNPFSSNDVGDLIDENTGVLNNRLGAGTYDLGHVYTQGGNNGVAALRSGCTGFAGAGATSHSRPENDPFVIDYVAHEMGHQLGGNHTQNNDCNYSSSAGMEPGSASSIMGYAGICSPNVQNQSDDYFHGRSIEEITTFLELGNGGSCATVVDMSLANPVVVAVPDHLIPAGTPFVLETSATGNGTLSYNWEQYDAAQGPMPPVGTSTVGPLFRSFAATEEGARYFPQLSAVVAGEDPEWEELPLVDRTLNFRLTAINRNAAYGCASEDNVRLTVDADRGPFTVTDPSNGNRWSAGQIAQIQWDVAGTDAGALNSPTVRVLLSTDGGLNFQPLASGLPNTGYAEVQVPGTLSNAARIMVRSEGNVFFNVSSQDFSIGTSSGTPSVAVTALDPTEVSDCFVSTDEVSLRFLTASSGGATAPIALSVTGLAPGLTASFSPATVRPGGVFTLRISGLSSVPAGTYPGQVKGGSTETNFTQNFTVTKTSGALAGPLALSPVGQAEDTRPTLRVQPTGADAYNFEISDQPDFSNILFSFTGPDPSYTPPGYLNAESPYFWRARTIDVNTNCGSSEWTVSPFLAGPCFQFFSTAAPAPISSGPPPQSANMALAIAQMGQITDLDLVSLDITHTYLSDLAIELVSPAGTAAVIFNEECGSVNNILATFDDEAAEDAFNCPPIGNDLFVRSRGDLLSAFDGESLQGNWTVVVNDGADQDGGAINGFGIKACLEANVLPVTFVSFTARGRKSDILLRWATEQETANRGFFPERTPVGQPGAWRELGFVAAGADYSFVDSTALPGQEYLYRLRQVDLDGTVTYSELRMAQIGAATVGAGLLLYPNPARETVAYRWAGPSSGQTPYRLTDAWGRVVQTGILYAGGGSIALDQRAAGVYYLTLTSAERQETFRLIRL